MKATTELSEATLSLRWQTSEVNTNQIDAIILHNVDPSLQMTTAKSTPDLTSGRLLAHNTLWNLAGQLFPVLVAAATIPVLIRGIGQARFGVLSIAWVVIGYFSLFDLGIGRALTKLVAEKIGAQKEHDIPSLVWMSLFLLFLLGLFGGAVTWLISPWLVYKALKVPVDLRIETLHGFYLLALSIPLVTVTSGLRGSLEALQRFRILNIIRIPMSVYSFAGPLLVLPFSHSLFPVIGVLAVGRVAGCLAHLFACFHAMPALRGSFTLQQRLVKPLLKMGGWLTACNLLGPALLVVDRFVIGALLSVAAVAYYTAPFDMLSRIWVIPGAISGVLFPAFAMTMAQDQRLMELLLRRGLKFTLVLIFPIVLTIVTLAPEILRLWLGADFAAQSETVLRWLAVGIFLNSISGIPFGLLQAIGRADIDAKVLLAELPFYLAAIWLLTERFGIKGTAIAWTGRAALELLIILFFSCRFLPGRRSALKPFIVGLVLSLLSLCLAMVPSGLALKGFFLVCALTAFLLVTWFVALKDEERVFFVRATRGRAPGSRSHP